MNSYNFKTSSSKIDSRTGRMTTKKNDGSWHEGDLVVNLKGCDASKERDCEEEMKGYYEKWVKEVKRLDGKVGEEF